MRDGNRTYYAFVKDWHWLAATSNVNSTYTINNVAPTISGGSVFLNAGNNIVLNMKGQAAKTVAASSTAVSDMNGCEDMSSGTSTIYLSGVAGGVGCTASGNNCFQIAQANCAISSCTAGQALATLTCTTTMDHYAISTFNGAAVGHQAESWYTRLTIIDDNSARGSQSYTTLDGVEVVALAAHDVTQATIGYGTIRSGQNTALANATTTVVNYGNTPLDTNISGDNMRYNANSIEILYQHYNLTNFDYSNAIASGTSAVASSSPATVQTNIARPVDLTNVSQDVYWGIGIPAGRPSGLYAGTNYFDIVQDNAGTWN